LLSHNPPSSIDALLEKILSSRLTRETMSADIEFITVTRGCGVAGKAIMVAVTSIAKADLVDIPSCHQAVEDDGVW
jgi:hypothetical protein